MIPVAHGEGMLNQPLARPFLERRDVYVRRLRDGIADRYGVPPSALASLDPSTVTTMAARVQEERVIRVRIEHAASPSRRRTVRWPRQRHQPRSLIPVTSRATVED